jgi:hypothetical protein
VGSALTSREDGLVDSLFEIGLLVLSEEDETSSGTSKGLVADSGKMVRGESREKPNYNTRITAYVVVVTTSQNSNGWFCSPAATNPEM